MPVSGKLQRLNPFLDKSGILRVGGRLSQAPMAFPQKHPIILPKAPTTSLIIENEHQVWRTIKGCVRCCRAHPPPVHYITGNLPEARVTESRPFANVGVDHCGPFYIKEKRDRNRRLVKVYVAIFVPLAVKAVRIKLVGDLTSEAFIAALRRFIARRGFCSTIHSDNGTNFISANNELKGLHELIKSEDHNEKVTTYLADKQIEWRFITPHSPHFGGLWEAVVKSFKHHFRRVVGNELLTFEQFNTLVIEIEAVLISRPLTQHHTDARIQWGCLSCERSFPKLHGQSATTQNVVALIREKDKCGACPMSFGTQRGLSTHERPPPRGVRNPFGATLC
ncbi:uncharacterized protein LOC122570075 [Bombus pyrosoma]|uniref:uncharacterized protein LOC122570075 n=1 Tax=Bombus pyrosoma TaxID=396416 RepID=UPI001CB93A92|nr:uncharacterized protein LOC122570075 [Bombus pyrosoma]